MLSAKIALASLQKSEDSSGAVELVSIHSPRTPRRRALERPVSSPTRSGTQTPRTAVVGFT